MNNPFLYLYISLSFLSFSLLEEREGRKRERESGDVEKKEKKTGFFSFL